MKEHFKTKSIATQTTQELVAMPEIKRTRDGLPTAQYAAAILQNVEIRGEEERHRRVSGQADTQPIAPIMPPAPEQTPEGLAQHESSSPHYADQDDGPYAGPVDQTHFR